jgi:hypothetical protein
MPRLLRSLVLAFAMLAFVNMPARAETVTIDFEHFPGPDGVLGTADDLAPSSLPYPVWVRNEFSSLGLIFEQGSLMRGDFFDGNPSNHFLSSTMLVGVFSIPVFGITIESNSYWDAILTAFDASGNVIGTDLLSNPDVGSSQMFGVLGLSLTGPIASFSITARDPNYILNLDNLELTVSAVPEPSQRAGFGLGLLLMAGLWARSVNGRRR